MDVLLWKNNILECVRDISDKNFQSKAWFNKSKEISSPDEIFCNFFDDFMIEEFLIDENSNLTHKQKKAMDTLVDAMNIYADSTPIMLDPETVFNDPNWDKIRNLAKNVLETFEE